MNKKNEKGSPLILDGTHYEWQQQFITGADLRQLGNIPEDFQVFLKYHGKDELISNEERVDLLKPGMEHFYSKRVENHLVTIIVNGREKSWNEKTISFEQVVRLAFENYVENDTTIYTVTYKRGHGEKPEGSMVKGDVITVKDKMIFNVTATDRS